MTEIKSKYFSNENLPMHRRILAYLNQLEPPIDIELPGKQVQWLFPHRQLETRRCIDEFYSKYYSDEKQRILILGINPGRFGGGTTGVPFTDPIRLKNVCQIDSNFPLKPELSSQFIYDYFLHRYSVETFFQQFFIGAICPLGLESNGRNMNYYDNKKFRDQLLEHFIPDQIQQQIDLGCSAKVAICLGEGLNYSTLEKLNEKYRFFGKILKLPHPRYIMQYKRKFLDDYVRQYIDTCQLAMKLTKEA